MPRGATAWRCLAVSVLSAAQHRPCWRSLRTPADAGALSMEQTCQGPSRILKDRHKHARIVERTGE